MRFRRPLLCGVAIAGLIMALAGPAEAGTLVLKDNRGDDPRGNDILKVRVVHKKERVKVRIRMDRIKRDSHGVLRGFGVYFNSRPKRPGAELYTGVSGGFDVYRLKHGKPWYEGDPQQRCYRGVRTDLKKRKGVAVFSVPHKSHCLGNPKSVRVRVRTGADRAPGGRPFSRPIRHG